jgi:glycosyltransferase involved in cell wall biosynthesis
LSFLALVPPGTLPATIARHDIGLALEPNVPANKNCTISNKILQYLNAGLAVLATPTAGHGEVLARGPDAGVIVDFHDTASATATLDALLADREALARRQKAARRLAAEVYCWEREAPKLLAAVEAALAATP